MNKVFSAMSLIGALAFAGLAPTEASAQGCCGPATSYRMSSGRPTAGRPWLSTGGSRPTGGCRMNMQGMNMQGMNMQDMNMSDMNMNGAAASQGMASTPSAGAVPPRGASYFCPMHPNVMSTFPATCPYCQMALQRR